MKLLVCTLLLCTSLVAQNRFEKGMEKTLSAWEEGTELKEIQTDFAELFKKNPTRWEPLYYATLTQILLAFEGSQQDAEKVYPSLDANLEKLKSLYSDTSEWKTLQGLYLTLKVSKNPFVLGQSLSPKILATYTEALRANAKNGRALYLFAQYNMNAAPYMGRDPKSYCKNANHAIALLEEESQNEAVGFEPRWGLNFAQDLAKEFCKE